MSIVVLQLGQGGNQMGRALFENLALYMPPSSSQTSSSFFRRSDRSSTLIARAVLVDTEPQVVASMMRPSKSKMGQPRWRYSNQSHVACASGSGNNWACGFHEYGPLCREKALDIIQSEVEKCDVFSGFVTLQSMAGGTGAGLGTYMVEALKDEFPSAFIMSHCIWPYESGEVVVQNYNVLLSLSYMQDLADGIIIVQNDQLNKTCKSMLGIARPSFNDMNEAATQALASVLLPSGWWPPQELSVAPAHSNPVDTNKKKHASLLINGACSHTAFPTHKAPVRLLSGLLSAVCTHPSYRMLALHFTPQTPRGTLDRTTLMWGAQLKQLRLMALADVNKDLELDWSTSPTSPLSENGSGVDSQSNHEMKTESNNQPVPNRFIANMLVLRGRGSDSVNLAGFIDEKMYPSWSTSPLSVACSPTSFGEYEISAGLLSNCQANVIPMSRALSRAYGMYASGAYVHQYLKYGLEKDSFEVAFSTVEDIISRYLTMT